MSADIYTGWIVAFVDGVWRHCRVSTGFCTFAHNDQPNQHLGLIPLDVIGAALDGKIRPHEIDVTPYLWVGPLVTEDDVLDRIAVVRFGRAAQAGAAPFFGLIDCVNAGFLHALMRDHDTPSDKDHWATGAHLGDTIGVYDLREPPRRWRRSILSTLHS